MLFTITQKCYVSMSEEEKQISIRNNFANIDQSLFARAGFFDIINLSKKLPLFRLPFSPHKAQSKSGKLHKTSIP